MNKLAPYYKAIAGAVVAFLTALATALDSGGDISSQEWITAGIALLVGGGAVFSIPNIGSNYPYSPPPPPPVVTEPLPPK